MINQIKLLKNLMISRYQTELKTLMKGSSFIFDHIHLLYYKCHKISLNHGE